MEEYTTDEKKLVAELAEIKKKLKVPTWYTHARLVARFHRICQKMYGIPTGGQGKSGWGLRDTAETLQLSNPTVVECVNVIKIIKLRPDLKHSKSRDEVFRQYQLNGGSDAQTTK